MNKTIVITGATNGTGYGVAQRFAQGGYDVVITSRDAGRAKEAAKRLEGEYPGITAFGYGLELLKEQDIKDMFNELKAGGRLVSDLVLVAANLGIGQPDFFDIEYDEWIKVINTNIGWNFMFCREAARHMVELGGGSIVVIGSVNGIRTIRDRSAYCTSKSGLHGLARNLAVELGHYRIRVNTIAAGLIKTERYWKSFNAYQNFGSAKAPIGDCAEFSDIANAAFFLASDEARIITGAELAVDGGALAQFSPEESVPKKN